MLDGLQRRKEKETSALLNLCAFLLLIQYFVELRCRVTDGCLAWFGRGSNTKNGPSSLWKWCNHCLPRWYLTQMLCLNSSWSEYRTDVLQTVITEFNFGSHDYYNVSLPFFLLAWLPVCLQNIKHIDVSTLYLSNELFWQIEG